MATKTLPSPSGHARVPGAPGKVKVAQAAGVRSHADMLAEVDSALARLSETVIKRREPARFAGLDTDITTRLLAYLVLAQTNRSPTPDPFRLHRIGAAEAELIAAELARNLNPAFRFDVGEVTASVLGASSASPKVHVGSLGREQEEFAQVLMDESLPPGAMREGLVRVRRGAGQPKLGFASSTPEIDAVALCHEVDALREQVRQLTDREDQRDLELLKLRSELASMGRSDAGPESAAPSAPSTRPLSKTMPAQGNRAAQALEAARAKFPKFAGDLASVEAYLAQSSEQVKAGWVRDRLLVGSAALGSSWGRTRQALEQACERGDLFNLKFANRRWYCAEFLKLSADDVQGVSELLKGLDPASQFIFWKRKHGSLGGMTLAQALRAGKRNEVLNAAGAFASEHRENSNT